MMGTRLSLYLSGASHFSRTLYLKGGRRVAVIDRTKRMKAAAKRMRAAGMRDYHICMVLRCPRSSVERVLSFDWHF